MLLFRSEEDIAQWAAKTSNPMGEALLLDKLWQLSKFWYHNRLSPEYRGRKPEETQAIFDSLGLTSAHWRILP